MPGIARSSGGLSGVARNCEEQRLAVRNNWIAIVVGLKAIPFYPFPLVVMAPLSQKSAFVFSVVECSVIVCDSVVATVR